MRQAFILTDANGQAESTLILGSDPGTNTVDGQVSKDIAQTAWSFNAEASPSTADADERFGW